MRIGFDLDNVFINTPPFIPDTLTERIYRKKTDGILLYRIPGRKEQLLRIALHKPIFRPKIKKNISFLQTLSETEHELYLISSRFGFLRKATERITKKYGLDTLFKKLYFNYENNQPHLFKDKVIKQLKLQKYVDDDLHLLKYIASKNNNIKLYWYNKKLDKKISKNIRAITRLEEILK